MNTNFYYNKYLKYKNKYLKYKEQFGGALGKEPCPKEVSTDTQNMSVSDFLRKTLCVYNQIQKHIPKKLDEFNYKALQEANKDETKHKITIADLKSRNFPHKFYEGKGYPLIELIAGGYLLFKLIEEAGFTFKDMKDAGVSLKDLKEKGGYGRNERNTPEILRALKEVGYTINQFYNNSFSLKQIIDAGFNLQEILEIQKYSLKVLTEAGFKAEDIEKIPDKEYTKEEILTSIKSKTGDFDDSLLKAINSKRKRKIDLSLIKDDVPIRILYFSGYSLEELKRSGFKSSDLINFIKENASIGGLTILKSIFTLEELLLSKTEIIDILNIGYNICELKIHGFGLQHFNIRRNIKLLENLSACYTLKELLEAGYTDLELKILELCNYSKDDILSMNFTLDNLVDKYGLDAITIDVLKYFSINDIFKYKILAEKFKFYDEFRIMIKQKIIDKEPINDDILTTYFTIKNLLNRYGLTFEELIQLGYDIREIPQSIIYFIKIGKNLSFFKAEDFTTIENLKNIGRYTAEEFKRAGYTVSQLKNDFHPLELKDAGYTIFEMREGKIDNIILYFLNYDFVPYLEFIIQHFHLLEREESSTPEILHPKSNLLRYVYYSSNKDPEVLKKYPPLPEIMPIEILLEQEISIPILVKIFKTYEDISLILYFFRIKEIPLHLIFFAMIESFPSKNIDSIIDHLKFIYEVKDFVESEIPQHNYQSKLPKRDLVKAGIDVEKYVEEVEGENYPYLGDPIGDALRSADGFIPLKIKYYISISGESNLATLLTHFNMSNIKETLEYYFRVPYMTPLHPMYKKFKKIDDEVYKTEKGLIF